MTQELVEAAKKVVLLHMQYDQVPTCKWEQGQCSCGHEDRVNEAVRKLNEALHKGLYVTGRMIA
jgi:hypothetical protein